MANGNPAAANQEQKAPTLADYRESVADAISLVEGLADDCQSLPDLIEMMKLALKNDSQLKLLIKKAGPVHFRG